MEGKKIQYLLWVMRQRAANDTAYKKAISFASRVTDEVAEFTEESYHEAEKALYTTNPTAAEMLVSFTKTTSKWATEGFPVVDEDAYKRRYATCSACEYWQTNPVDRCAACGCKGFKLWLQTAKCKKGKWID